MLKIKDNFDLDKLLNIGFKKQTHLNEYGKEKEYGFDIYRYADRECEYDNEDLYKFDFQYGITIFTKNNEYYFKNIVYIMDDDSSYIESPAHKLPSILLDLFELGALEKVEEIKE